VVALHSGRPPSVDLEVEAEIVFLFGIHEEVLTRWEMFMTLDEALSRAAESHGRERA
jgi:hypothetical protein